MPLLGTRLRTPTARRQLVPRERLVDQLRADPTRMPRLVLVSATGRVREDHPLIPMQVELG